MTNAEKLQEFLTNFDDGIVIAEGCEHAFIGVSNTPDGYRAVYSTERIISNMMEEDMMSFDDAEEYMHLNILGKSSYGDRAPIFVDIVPDEFWKDDTTDLGDRTV
jgi:hypothetical protein